MTTIDLVDQDTVRRRDKSEAERALERARELARVIVRCNEIMTAPVGHAPSARMAAAFETSNAIRVRSGALEDLLALLL